jgi:guanine deaminase
MQRSSFLSGGLVLRTNAAGISAERCEILVTQGQIAALLPPGAPRPDDAVVIDASDRLIMPGLVNAHTHGHGALGRGAVGDRVSLEMFLSGAGAINGNRSLDDKRLTTLLSAAELIRRGCTSCYDLFVEVPLPTVEGIHAVATGYREAGLRAVVAPMMADRTLFQALPGLLDSLPPAERRRAEALATAPHSASLEACRAILNGWTLDRAEQRPALAPTIPLHCSDAFLTGCRDLAEEFDVGIQTHLGETRSQAVLGLARYGRSLTAHLQHLGLLRPNLSAAHGIWLEDDDLRRLADAGIAGISHNPMSNLRIGSGIAPTRRMLDHGITLGIGTDASNTGDGQNMFEAMRLGSYLSRIAEAEPERWLSVEESFAAATTGSAAILGLDRVGRIEPGWAADLVLLDLAAPHYVPLRDALRQMLFAESGAAVDSVMVAGRLLLDRGRLLTLDEAALRGAAQQAAVRLDAANAPAKALAAALERHVACFCLGTQRLLFGARRNLVAEAVAQNPPSGR